MTSDPVRPPDPPARPAPAKSILTLGAAVLAALLPGLTRAAQDAPAEARIARAARTTASILIDGSLDEPAWQEAEPITRFTQRFPAEGDDATQATEVRILFDDERLLIGVRLHDTEPGRIVARELKEDSELYNDDSFGVLIDTFYDRRNAYFFETNPNGARTDALVYDEGRTRSFDWDGVWDVAARVDEGGWTAEFAIPFRTLNFDPGRVNPWGLQFRRGIRRNAEDVYWAPIPRNEDLWRVSRAGELHGLEAIRQGSRLTVKPYALGRASDLPSIDRDRDTTGDVGFDARYSITPNLVGVVTYNTDFAETEVDRQQVNVTRFPLFFPEKREFFLESTGFFDFGFNPIRFGSPNAPIPFFSRRVGLSEASDLPVPIQGGVKLVGRLARYNVGFLSINTDEDGSIPQTNYSALRVSRDILTRSNWGIIGVSKEPVGPDRDGAGVVLEDHSNRTFGADVNFSVLENLKFGGSFLETDTPGVSGGEGSRQVYANWSDNTWQMEFDHQDIAEGFNPEVGFVERTGIENTEVMLGWNWRSGTAPVRRIEPHGRVNYTTDQDHDLATRRQHWATTVEFRDGSEVELAWNPSFDRLDETFVLDEEEMAEVRPGGYDMDAWMFRWRGDESRVLSGSIFTEWGDFFDGDFVSLQASANARPSKHVQTSLSLRRTIIDLPARPDDPADPNDVARTASEFDFTLIQGQFGVRFSTTVFVDALLQYNTDVEDFSTDLRFNWKYRPGSDLYVVYRERRDIESEATPGDDRSLTVKWTYQLAF